MVKTSEYQIVQLHWPAGWIRSKSTQIKKRVFIRHDMSASIKSWRVSCAQAVVILIEIVPKCQQATATFSCRYFLTMDFFFVFLLLIVIFGLYVWFVKPGLLIIAYYRWARYFHQTKHLWLIHTARDRNRFIYHAFNCAHYTETGNGTGNGIGDQWVAYPFLHSRCTVI